MAKKNFKSGINDLFEEALDQQETPTKKTSKSKTSSKSFMSNLDDFLQETIEEGVREQAERVKNQKKKPKTKRKKPVFGLDNLIRQTVETSQVEVTDKNKKRVTFVFDKEKIEKLKQIARLEKAYVKDIVNDLITEYIEKNS